MLLMQDAGGDREDTGSDSVPQLGGSEALGSGDDTFCSQITRDGFGGEALVSGCKFLSGAPAQCPVHESFLGQVQVLLLEPLSEGCQELGELTEVFSS